MMPLAGVRLRWPLRLALFWSLGCVGVVSRQQKCDTSTITSLVHSGALAMAANEACARTHTLSHYARTHGRTHRNRAARTCARTQQRTHGNPLARTPKTHARPPVRPDSYAHRRRASRLILNPRSRDVRPASLKHTQPPWTSKQGILIRFSIGCGRRTATLLRRRGDKCWSHRATVF